jgi:serine/threonine-protein kinase
MVIDAYKLIKRLGKGMSAEVWQARVVEGRDGVPVQIGQEVAIKLYFPGVLLQGMQTLRVQREFAVASEWQHKHLASVYDLVLSPSRPNHVFLVMEYVHGSTLKQYISRKKILEFNDILTIAKQLFSALQEMHSLGALHRDIKAANIMVVENGLPGLNIKLLDFGIISVENEIELTGSMFIGSKHSAPIEQLTGEKLDERADIYAAGTVLYYCYSGKPMYSGTGPEGAIVRRMLQQPEKLGIRSVNIVSSKEAEFVNFVNRCISINKEERPASASDCLLEIEYISENKNSYSQQSNKSKENKVIW